MSDPSISQGGDQNNRDTDFFPEGGAPPSFHIRQRMERQSSQNLDTNAQSSLSLNQLQDRNLTTPTRATTHPTGRQPLSEGQVSLPTRMLAECTPTSCDRRPRGSASSTSSGASHTPLNPIRFIGSRDVESSVAVPPSPRSDQELTTIVNPGKLPNDILWNIVDTLGRSCGDPERILRTLDSLSLTNRALHDMVATSSRRFLRPRAGGNTTFPKMLSRLSLCLTAELKELILDALPPDTGHWNTLGTVLQTFTANSGQGVNITLGQNFWGELQTTLNRNRWRDCNAARDFLKNRKLARLSYQQLPAHNRILERLGRQLQPLIGDNSLSDISHCVIVIPGISEQTEVAMLGSPETVTIVVGHVEYSSGVKTSRRAILCNPRVRNWTFAIRNGNSLLLTEDHHHREDDQEKESVSLMAKERKRDKFTRKLKGGVKSKKVTGAVVTSGSSTAGVTQETVNERMRREFAIWKRGEPDFQSGVEIRIVDAVEIGY